MQYLQPSHVDIYKLNSIRGIIEKRQAEKLPKLYYSFFIIVSIQVAIQSTLIFYFTQIL